MTMEELLKEFTAYLSVEKGLSRNTILAYTSDLKKYISYLHKVNIQFNNVKHNDLTEFLWQQKNEGLKPRSIYRLMETLRHFYRFLMIENKLKSDPAENLVPPKLSPKLPDCLNVDEVERLLNAVSGEKERDVRNRAMIELLYAAGLRVSELVDLDVGSVDTKLGFVRVIGKGNKERIVPAGRTALRYIEKYMAMSSRRPCRSFGPSAK